MMSLTLVLRHCISLSLLRLASGERSVTEVLSMMSTCRFSRLASGVRSDTPVLLMLSERRVWGSTTESRVFTCEPEMLRSTNWSQPLSILMSATLVPTSERLVS